MGKLGSDGGVAVNRALLATSRLDDAPEFWKWAPPELARGSIPAFAGLEGAIPAFTGGAGAWERITSDRVGPSPRSRGSLQIAPHELGLQSIPAFAGGACRPRTRWRRSWGVTVNGRRSYTFAGNDQAARRSATFYTWVKTCRLRGVDPPT